VELNKSKLYLDNMLCLCAGLDMHVCECTYFYITKAAIFEYLFVQNMHLYKLIHALVISQFVFIFYAFFCFI